MEQVVASGGMGGGIWGFFKWIIASPFRLLFLFLGFLFSKKWWRLSWSILFGVIILTGNIVEASRETDNFSDGFKYVINNFFYEDIIKGDITLEQDLKDNPIVYPSFEGNIFDKGKILFEFLFKILKVVANIWMFLIVWVIILYSVISARDKSKVADNMGITFLVFISISLIAQIYLTLIGKIDLRFPYQGIYEFLKQMIGITPELAGNLKGNVENITNISGG